MPDQSATFPAQSRLHRIVAQWREGLLCLLVLATFMMPVSYRAGTDTSHPHTIYQVMIDAIMGTPHTHGETVHQPVRVTPSPFAPVSVPLNALVQSDDAVDPAGEPDTPVVLQLSSPISATSAIQLLALIVAGLLLFGPYRPTWASIRALHPMPDRIETPPPRPA